ncbi:preprotein translocase subunit SecG [Pigmentiphaga sp.]|jgi:protein translocase, SecG subunit|uniref:preprotein translocase subunit SecG n=1 Tax=Pigmentiphaga sp. TaxID=1977564 RepID=UPI0025F73343|nr:preprotein translocase subunit SecG [Pigmentiphaga sp.]MBX6319894.1 preprotein translocase subunit SecG [Pigmentiphaga sp.]
MSVLLTVLLIVQVISALTIIVLVLLQQGKGADMGSAFGGGSAGSLFGAAGAANFLSRTTKWAAVVFFITTAALAYLGRPMSSAPEGGVMESFNPDQTVPSVPGSTQVPPPAAPDASVPPAPSAAPQENAPAQPEAEKK